VADLKDFILCFPEGAGGQSKLYPKGKVVLSAHSPQSYPQKLWIKTKST
jgi:hypothetical protein